MGRRTAISATVAALAAGPFAPGCARPRNPWTYAEPPAVALVRASNPQPPGRILVAVADFTNPVAPQLPWPTLGQEMSRAMRRTLFKNGYEVRLAPDVEKMVAAPGFLGSKAPQGSAPPEVDYVMTGQVTDFHHTAGLPKDASRWGLIGRRHEAVTAFEWKVVDVRNRRLVAIDHTYGTAESSGKKSVAELYAGLDPSAYLFWNTPLGRSAHAAVDRTVDRMKKILPPDSPPPAPPPVAPAYAAVAAPMVVQAVAPRQLAVTGPGLVEGQEYYLTLAGPGGSRRAVRDCDTGRPLVVTIGTVSRDGAEGWVLGKAAAGTDLRGALLERQLPAETAGPDDWRAAALDGDDT